MIENKKDQQGQGNRNDQNEQNISNREGVRNENANTTNSNQGRTPVANDDRRSGTIQNESTENRRKGAERKKNSNTSTAMKGQYNPNADVSQPGLEDKEEIENDENTRRNAL